MAVNIMYGYCDDAFSLGTLGRDTFWNRIKW